MRPRLRAATGASVRDQERAMQLYRIRIEEFGAGREKVRGMSRGVESGRFFGIVGPILPAPLRTKAWL